eukprot:355330-Chlamydomonas_euryale.AAC.5
MVSARYTPGRSTSPEARPPPSAPLSRVHACLRTHPGAHPRASVGVWQWATSASGQVGGVVRSGTRLQLSCRLTQNLAAIRACEQAGMKPGVWMLW